MNKNAFKKAIAMAKRGGGIAACSREALSEAFNVPMGSLVARRLGVAYTAFITAVAKELPINACRVLPPRVMAKELRRRQLLAVAIELAEAPGGNYATLTREQIADAAGVTAARVAQVYTLPQLKADLCDWALRNNRKRLLRQMAKNNDKLLDD